jgi:hypothetical protein
MNVSAHGPHILAALAAALAGSAAIAQQAVDRTQTWTAPGVAGWTTEQGSTLANPGGYLNVGFASQTVPAFVADVAGADVAPGMRITNICFRFRSGAVAPSAWRLYLHSRTGSNVWQFPLPAVTTGTWVSVRVPVRFEAGWYQGPLSSARQFLADMGSVDEAGVYIRRHMDVTAQSYAIDDFQLQGLATTPGDRDGDGIPDTWEDLHGLDADDPGDAAQDADADGTSNRAEYIAGTDPRNPDSRLDVEAALTMTNESAIMRGVVLRWNSATNRVYTVWRTRTLTSAPFAPLAEGITSTPPVNVYEDRSATKEGSFFYRIEVKP